MGFDVLVLGVNALVENPVLVGSPQRIGFDVLEENAVVEHWVPLREGQYDDCCEMALDAAMGTPIDSEQPSGARNDAA